jgi:hypothetical protein
MGCRSGGAISLLGDCASSLSGVGERSVNSVANEDESSRCSEQKVDLNVRLYHAPVAGVQLMNVILTSHCEPSGR